MLVALVACATPEPSAEPDLPCIPRSTRCASVTAEAVCSEDGLAWQSAPCGVEAACLSSLPGARCEEHPDGARSVEENLASITRLSLPGGGTCTAFFVADDVLLTNHHCCPDPEACVGAVADPLYRSPGIDPTAVELLVVDTIATTQALDAAALRVELPDGFVAPHVVFEVPRDLTREPIYVVGHPAGRPLESALGIAYLFADEVTYQYASGPKTKLSQVLYWAQAEPGSSGSPVFSVATHALAMLHHTGAAPRALRGDARADGEFTQLLGATDAR
ncbi:MAG: serine protease [Sandaracinaceae bacterium]